MSTSQYGQIPKPVYLVGTEIITATVGVPDLSAFTYGTSLELPVGGVYQDTSPTVTAGHSAAFRITANRGLHSNLRNSSGNEMIGQTTMAGSIPVAIASDQAAYPINLQDGVGNVIKSTVNALWTQIQGPLGQTGMANSLPVAIASDQTTLNTIVQDNVASGNITSTQNISLITTGMGTVGIQVTGTWTGTIVLEGSLDLTNYTAVNAVNSTTGAVVSSITANGFYQVGVAGIWSFRVRGNSVATGTAVISMRGNPRNSAISIENPIPAGSAVIGAVTQNGTWTVQPGNTPNTTPWLATINQGGNSATVTASNALKVDGSAVTQPISGNVGAVAQSTSAITSVASSASSVTILAANASRKSATIFNDSTQVLYLALTSNAATTSAYTVQIPSNSYYELPFNGWIYTGQITGIWASANGNARVTELT